MSLSAGEIVLGRYEIDGFLSAGGMGSVYRAHHRTLGLPVVVKIVSFEGEADVRARFEREAMLMARVRHPCVVRILDYGILDDQRPCIAMELAEGQDLSNLIREKGALPWREALRIVDGVAAGLTALHGAGVLHRDLKPANVVYAP